MRKVLALLALVLMLPSAAHAAAPANDTFGRARAVDTMPFEVSQSTSGATLERREAQPGCARAVSTVWFRFTTADRVPIGVSTFGSTYDTVVGVYTGSRPDRLRAIACDDDGGTREGSVVAWDAEPGAVYLIQIGSARGARAGTLRMRLALAPHAERGSQQAFNAMTPFSIAAIGHAGRIDAAAEAGAAYCLNTQCVPIAEARADADRAPATGAGSQNACVIAAGRVSTCP